MNGFIYISVVDHKVSLDENTKEILFSCSYASLADRNNRSIKIDIYKRMCLTLWWKEQEHRMVHVVESQIDVTVGQGERVGALRLGH